MIPSDFDPDAVADPYDWDALARFVSRECTPKEERDVQAWLDARPERAQLVAALRQSLDTLALDTTTDVDVEGALRRVHARMAAPVETSEVAPLPARRPQLHRVAGRTASNGAADRWRAIGALAAAAAIVVTAIGVWRARQHVELTPAATIEAATYTTAIGQRDSVRLADGTTVILGPSSRLDVAAGYGSSTREVMLRGEAYFAVRHDAARPFTVRAGNAKIVDIGTTFTVRDDSGEAVRVAVTAGSVRVTQASSTDTGVVLAAGDVATLARATAPTVARGSATADDTAFTRGALVLRDAPLAQVASELRRWYGVELRVTNSVIAHRHLTATFAGESPDQAMAIIGAALGARIERRGDTVTVR